MTPEELAQVKGVIHDTISEATKTTAEKVTGEVQTAIKTHINGDDHRYIRVLIEKDKRKAENMEKLKGNFIFWLLITCTSGIGIAVWQYFKKSINE